MNNTGPIYGTGMDRNRKIDILKILLLHAYDNYIGFKFLKKVVAIDCTGKLYYKKGLCMVLQTMDRLHYGQNFEKS